MKLELGGGLHARGGDWLNLDLMDVPGVHACIDFERLGVAGSRLPFDDDAVDEVYASHSLEHLDNVVGILREVARVCKIGAAVEIRSPHFASDMAMCPGHKCVLSEHWFRDITEHFAGEWWRGLKKRLKLVRCDYVRWGPIFDEAKRAFPMLTDDQITRLVPGACFDVRYHLEVVPYDS